MYTRRVPSYHIHPTRAVADLFIRRAIGSTVASFVHAKRTWWTGPTGAKFYDINCTMDTPFSRRDYISRVQGLEH